MEKRIVHHNNLGGYIEKYREKGYEIHNNSGLFSADTKFLDIISKIRYPGLCSFKDSLNNICIEARKSKGRFTLILNSSEISYSISSLYYPLTDKELLNSLHCDLTSSYGPQVDNIKEYLGYISLLKRYYSYSSNGADIFFDKNNFECKSCNSMLEKVTASYTYYPEEHEYFEIRVSNVPTQYCSKCGKFYFDKLIITKIKRDLLSSSFTPQNYGDLVCIEYNDGHLQLIKFPYK